MFFNLIFTLDPEGVPRVSAPVRAAFVTSSWLWTKRFREGLFLVAGTFSRVARDNLDGIATVAPLFQRWFAKKRSRCKDSRVDRSWSLTARGYFSKGVNIVFKKLFV